MKMFLFAWLLAFVISGAGGQSLPSKDGSTVGTGCSDYNRVDARKNLIDGSKAYKDHKFQEAEQLFRYAVSCDPKGESIEGKTARIFLARTLHSEYIGNRQDKSKAEDAIQEYKKVLSADLNEQSAYKAIASLLENLEKNDEWLSWVTERAKNENILPQNRADALVSLAARMNTCANDITEISAQTVIKGGKQVIQFVRPEGPETLEKLKTCVTEGKTQIDQAILLESVAGVMNAKSINIASASDEELKRTLKLLRVFESARSYKAALLIQAMRLAEMEGRTVDRDRLRREAAAAKSSFLELRGLAKAIQNELDKRAVITDLPPLE